MEILKEEEKRLVIKKEYTAPVLEIVLIEMEQGIAAGSASVNVGVDVSGNATAVDTDWGGSEDTVIDTPF
ncbi:hypothetical protein BAX97_08040 [Elizabethkingia meningoseptica]|uniref:hypothetical protein n=1 Tax=Elizabethkingia meningoseptica TaxID=238 RepID=UPI000332CC9A|nr:hypothetical protein [Elizabethkingia meningoseptica]AQX06506.1 hypothetical protein BBD33_15110 [Elizabethkingia meningoseptica]AQX48553.1 hypothetical protein B5G46_15100 [Elizabethkingia meningoseptica]EOR28563.1 hypothetical protein L100_15645 [Elizabethkingia meningoseptica ATCC 13253 = NBRC 12535]KUY13606.1 hypothetical protein ATB99_13710 [Elizabethkingia meningoseptica]OPB75503.1 hypothetical protein BAY30_00065 [Elizabethkingia meningoseptica]